jgi:hypothetical protein
VCWMLQQNCMADVNLVASLYKQKETEGRDVRKHITHAERLAAEKDILPIEGAEDKVCTDIDG